MPIIRLVCDGVADERQPLEVWYNRSGSVDHGSKRPMINDTRCLRRKLVLRTQFLNRSKDDRHCGPQRGTQVDCEIKCARSYGHDNADGFAAIFIAKMDS